MPLLLTERLQLREFIRGDEDFVLTLMNSPGWLRYIGDRHLRTPDQAWQYLEHGPIASFAGEGFGLMHVLTRDGDTRLGMCGLLRRPALPEIELGFAFLGEHEGRGYATEAARAVVADARQRLGLRRLAAVVQPDNAGSLRVLAKLGFRFERRVHLTAEAPALHLFARELGGEE